MSYSVRYRAEWRATTRGERNYVVDILKKDYNGDVSPIYLTGDCITLTFGEVDESELAPIKSSEAEITVLCTEPGNPYTELYTLDPAEYQVNILEDGVLIWRGYLATGEYLQPLANPPYTVRLRANDGLGVLMAMPYLDSNGEKFVHKETVSDLIRRLLSPISDSVNIWHYELIRHDQTSHTFDIVSLRNDAIYRAFGEGAPTYYEVLKEVLSAFSVQLMQHQGEWIVRSLSSLIASANSRLVDVIDLNASARGNYGVSSSATLSMVQPVKKVVITPAVGEESIMLNSLICNADNWQRNAYDVAFSQKNQFTPTLATYKNEKAIIVQPGVVVPAIPQIVLGTAWQVLPFTIRRSNALSLKISFDVCNKSHTQAISALYVGLWLIDASASTDNVVDVQRIEYTPGAKGYVKVNVPAIYWDGEQWQKLRPEIETPYYNQVGLKLVEVPISEDKSSVPRLEKMAKTTVAFELPSIPSYKFDASAPEFCNEWRIAIVVACGDKNSLSFITSPSIMLSKSTAEREISICASSSSEVVYTQKWKMSGDGVAPAVVAADTEKPVYGYLCARGTEVGDIVGDTMQALRGSVSIAIEGETDNAIGYGCNNVCRAEGRFFYTNYVRKKIKRGVADIQLRELRGLTDTNGSILMNVATAPSSDFVSMGNSIFYYTKALEPTLRRIDVQTKRIKVVAPISTMSTSAALLARGVECVTIAELTDSGTQLTAYSGDGVQLAKVVDFYDERVSASMWYSTARYDATREIWLASDGKQTVVMCDKEGYVMSKFTIPDKLDSYAESKILIYNSGFVYCVATSSGAYHNYWHCYDIHKDGEFGTEAWAHKHEDIRMINDRFLISRSASGGYIVYVRNSMDLTDIPSQVTLSQGYEVVDINGAMVLTRGSSGAAIYDFRSTSSSRYYLLNIGADGKAMALCGDIVAAVNVTPLVSIQWKRVIPRLSDLITVNTVDNGRE